MIGILIKAVSFIPDIIRLVESIFGAKNGAKKLALAQTILTSVLAGAEFVSGKDIVDNAMFEEGQQEAISGIVKMLNASVWYKKP